MKTRIFIMPLRRGKSNPWLLFAVSLVAALAASVWAYQSYRAAHLRWQKSMQDLTECQALAIRIESLQQKIESEMRPASTDYDMATDLMRMLTAAELADTDTSLRIAGESHHKGAGLREIKIQKPVNRPLTLHQLARWIIEMDTGPVRFFVKSVELSEHRLTSNDTNLDGGSQWWNIDRIEISFFQRDSDKSER